MVNFTKEWIDGLETFNSIDDYNEKCNSDEGVVATDIVRLDVTEYDEQGLVTTSKTYSIDVIKILNNYYLEYQRTKDAVDNFNEDLILEQENLIPIAKEELYAITDLECKLEDNL